MTPEVNAIVFIVSSNKNILLVYVYIYHINNVIVINTTLLFKLPINNNPRNNFIMFHNGIQLQTNIEVVSLRVSFDIGTP